MSKPSSTDLPWTRRSAFNLGWSYRVKSGDFAALLGAGADEWRDVVLPHDALIGVPRNPERSNGSGGAYFPGGVFEYRNSFAVPETVRGQQVRLAFDGVYRDASVWVNGALAARQPYGYSRFIVRIDPYLDFGAQNEVRVECRSHQDSRWYTGAGIYRDVAMIITPAVCIAVDGVVVETTDVDQQRAIAAVATRIENSGPTTRTVRLAATVTDQDGNPVATDSNPVTLLPGETAVARLRMPIPRPRLWSVDQPNLYAVQLTLSDGDQQLDRERVRFGVRTLQVDPAHGLRINGESIKLRGACIHADNGPLGSAAIPAAEERKIRLLKAAGFNAIRSSHHPAGPALLDACDRVGMLVMDEAFDIWTSSKTDFDYAGDFPQWWERDLEAMVAKDINHPSVIFYSIGNEIPETGNRYGAGWSRRLAEKLRGLDHTRLITNGINAFISMLDVARQMLADQQQQQQQDESADVNQLMAGIGAAMGRIQNSEEATVRTEESFAVLDVAGMNYADQRYESDRERFANRVIVGTETFAPMIGSNWELVRSNSHVIGDFTWTGLDYLGEVGIGMVHYADDPNQARKTGSISITSDYPALTAWCGDLDITGHRRPASYYREIVFGLRTDPYLAVQRADRHGQQIVRSTPWSWTDTIAGWTWDGYEGQPIDVEVYADADEVELRLNGAPVGRSEVGGQLPWRADFTVDYLPGELTAVAYRDGQQVGQWSVRTAGPSLQLRAESDRDKISSDPSDLAFVTLTLTDEDGEPHTGRDREITVQVTGPGILQALGSGAPVTEETFDAPSHQSFDGRALAIIRPTGPGEITVTAEAADCPPVSIKIISE